MGKAYLVKKQVKPQIPVVEGGKPRILFVGDAPRSAELHSGEPLAGFPQKLMRSMLKQAGLDFDECFITNVFSRKAVSDKINDHYFVKLQQAKQIEKDTAEVWEGGIKAFRQTAKGKLSGRILKRKVTLKEGWKSPYPKFGAAGFLKAEYENEIDRLVSEFEHIKPDAVVALGACALWALTGLDKLGAQRGVIQTTSERFGSVPLMATYHPYAIVKNWNARPIAIADIKKIYEDVSTGGAERVERELWIYPTYKDIVEFKETYIDPLKNTDTPLSFDIETAHRTITCIGFATGKEKAITIPFFEGQAANGSYWATAGAEVNVWNLIKEILEDPTIVKVAQNQAYDVYWLAMDMGIKVRGLIHDTMHAEHSLQPEMPKGLAHLATIYCNEASWKSMVSFSKNIKGAKKEA